METAVPTDVELLADWLAHRRESAFHALVSRYAALVHMAAKRACGDDSLAAEASQLTFILLARKAKSLGSRSSLGGWLHLTAAGEAKNLLRSSKREARKRAHLNSAMDTRTPDQPDESWQEIQPFLNDALAALSEKDREALLLRFYRSLSIREIAATLGIATDAAQKRIDRATERLRGKLTRRGCQVGGSLSAAMLAGFAADAQAAALPVSLLASKAIAAGAAGSLGGLSVLFASIATLMKTSSWIPPVVTLIIAGVWTGTKYQFLATVEAGNARLRDEIALAQTSRTAIPIKTRNEDGPINWQKLATEEEKGPEMQRLVRRLKSMTREEMIDVLDKIAALECASGRRKLLESAVVWPLMQIDSEWVLNHFAKRLRDDELKLHHALGIWARKDLAKAAAWLDAQIAAGNLNCKQLDENRDGQARHLFEAALIDVLLASDPAAAARRLGALPEKQRESVISSLTNEMSGRVMNQPLTEGNHLAFANLVRSQLPAEQQVAVLFRGAPYFRSLEDYPVFSAYLEKIEATPAERMSCTEKFAGANIYRISNHRKVNRQDIDAIRGWFRETSPDSVDSCTGRALSEAMLHRVTSMRLAQASEIAVELLETEGIDEVLATLLETAKLDKPEVKLALELTNRIPDETRRAAIVKYLATLTFP